MYYYFVIIKHIIFYANEFFIFYFNIISTTWFSFSSPSVKVLRNHDSSSDKGKRRDPPYPRTLPPMTSLQTTSFGHMRYISWCFKKKKKNECFQSGDVPDRFYSVGGIAGGCNSLCHWNCLYHNSFIFELCLIEIYLNANID